MRLLTPTSAGHFCASFSANTSTQVCTVKEYLRRSANRNVRSFVEGTPKFAEFRDCLLREAERSLFFSNALYSNAMTANRAATSGWTFVTLYYSAFMAAQGLLAMHGGWIVGKDFWIESTNGTPGSLELTVRKTIHPRLTSLKGPSSHKAFWSLFYWAVRTLHTHAPNQLAFALTPIQSSDTWLIDTRNKYNYQMPAALQLMQHFSQGYNGQQLPQSMPSQIVTVDNTATALLELGADWRAAYSLSSDIVAGTYPTLQSALSGLVKTQRDPALDAFSNAKLQALRI